jgi:TnpA family transposase
MPVRKAQKELIINEWDNVQRIIVSLALKATTQSTIVSKLSAYARNNRTKRALWEYDNIIQSLYLLNYIDSVPLRQKRSASGKPRRKLSPVTPSRFLCELRKTALQNRV